MLANSLHLAYNCTMSDALRVPPFPFDSSLAAKAVELERRRGDLPRTADRLPALAEMSQLYRLISSIASARIEGNRTTLVDAVEGARLRESRPGLDLGDPILEILHLEDAAEHVDRHVAPGSPLTHTLVRELHHVATDGLQREGDETPGQYRERNVRISGSAHTPPAASLVHPLMTDLLDFANAPAEPHMHLVRMAVAHHRFVWIHPFGNGNGRTARLFSYAMIRAYGFAPDVDYPTINPTTVFGADRQGYYDHLAAADSLSDDGLLSWIEFVVSGLLRDVQAVHRLSEADTLLRLVRSAVHTALAAGSISRSDADVLTATASGTPFKAGDVADALPGTPSARSRAIASMVDRQLLKRTAPTSRTYQVRLSPNAVTPFLFRELDRLHVLPSIIRDEP
ncbi:Fic family protein [Brachybacterium sp. DNPG3]